MAPTAAVGSSVHRSGFGRWHFVLERLDGPGRLEAADSEAPVNRERLALLSVVRGLEALEQPSSVTLVTTSRYVSRGLRYGLNTWRDADYTWERFGVRRPVRNADLWQRVDVALKYHGVTCRLIQSSVAPAASAVPTHPSVVTELIAAPENRQEKASGGVDGVKTESMVVSQTHKNRSGLMAACLQQSVWFSDLAPLSNWWGLASEWIRWWRGRMQARPMFHGV
jgi:ribonuclease HI